MINLITYKELKRTTVFFMLKPCYAVYAFIISLVLVCIGLFIWSAFAPMNDIVKVTVVLRPMDAVSIIRSVTGGEVVAKKYENGDMISIGQLLFKIDTASMEQELESNIKRNKRIDELLFINSILLNSMYNGVFPFEVEQTEAYIKASSYLYEMQRYESTINDMALKLQREKEKPQSLTVPQNIVDMQTEYDRTIMQYNTWKNSQLSSALELQQQLETEKNLVEDRKSELERGIRNATLYAPVSGTISEVKKMNEGDYVMPGEEVIKIVPVTEGALKADLYIDPLYIARISAGNPVRIRFPGLPPSRYGQIETAVSLIPPDCTFTAAGTPIFIAEAIIEEPYLISKEGKKAQLVPGITAEGRIITEKNTVLRMVLRKLDFIQ